jgi:dTDP-4-amino-4,6-dideoxygalactose transaminase
MRESPGTFPPQRACAPPRAHCHRDAAQAVGASWQGREPGSFGDFGLFSFYHSKNIACGEAGALIIHARDAARAHVVQQYGTNYEEFRQGRAPNYLWLEMGPSFMPSDLTAALLAAQLERADDISHRGRAVAAIPPSDGAARTGGRGAADRCARRRSQWAHLLAQAAPRGATATHSLSGCAPAG